MLVLPSPPSRGEGFRHLSGDLYRVVAFVPMFLGEMLSVFRFLWWPIGLMYCSWLYWALPFW